MSLPPPSRSSTFQHQRVQVWIWGIKRSHNGNSVMSLCAPSFIPPTCCYIPALILKGKKRRGAVKRLVSRHKMFQISLSSTSDSEQTWSSLPTSVQTGPNWTLSPRPPPLSPLPLPPEGGSVTGSDGPTQEPGEERQEGSDGRLVICYVSSWADHCGSCFQTESQLLAWELFTTDKTWGRLKDNIQVLFKLREGKYDLIWEELLLYYN